MYGSTVTQVCLHCTAFGENATTCKFSRVSMYLHRFSEYCNVEWKIQIINHFTIGRRMKVYCATISLGHIAFEHCVPN